MAIPSDRPSTTRRRRGDGERTHAAILEAATRLASIEGIYGLTIGRLAETLGVRKSGLYAHFGSKERLQLETIDRAEAIFENEVVRPALEAPEGVGRLQALCEADLSYIERSVFPGGCFFAGLLAEVDARPGPIHDRIASNQRDWLDLLAEQARVAQQRGEIGEEADVLQLAFELEACLEVTNYNFILFGDPEMIERGRRAVRA
ncbi:MAG: TetR/AcrR family transcriptional regulator, partial [Actinomycetota bacterium]